MPRMSEAEACEAMRQMPRSLTLQPRKERYRFLSSWQELRENIILWIAMAQVLAKSLGESNPELAAALGAPLFHRDDIVVHAVMLQQPVALAGVAGEHVGLQVD